MQIKLLSICVVVVCWDLAFFGARVAGEGWGPRQPRTTITTVCEILRTANARPRKGERRQTGFLLSFRIAHFELVLPVSPHDKAAIEYRQPLCRQGGEEALAVARAEMLGVAERAPSVPCELAYWMYEATPAAASVKTMSARVAAASKAREPR